MEKEMEYYEKKEEMKEEEDEQKDEEVKKWRRKWSKGKGRKRTKDEERGKIEGIRNGVQQWKRIGRGKEKRKRRKRKGRGETKSEMKDMSRRGGRARKERRNRQTVEDKTAITRKRWQIMIRWSKQGMERLRRR